MYTASGLIACIAALNLAAAAQAQIPAGQNMPVGGNVPNAAGTLYSDAGRPDISPVLSNETKDLRVAPQLFLQHINNARTALSEKEGDLARQHLNAALSLVHALKASAARTQDYVFALSNAPVTLSSQPQSGQQPFGTKAYLSLNLGSAMAERDLQKAIKLSDSSKYQDAEAALSELVNDVIVQITVSRSFAEGMQR